VSVKTRVRATSETVVGDEEIQYQRYRTLRFRDVVRQVNIPTMFIMNQENERYRQDLYMSVGVMKDSKLNLRNPHYFVSTQNLRIYYESRIER
jgi:hypothetical protein